MRDLIDIHRSNIAQAGVTLAEAIAEATGVYSASVAASEAALEISIEKRIAAFNGAAPIEPPKPVEQTPVKDDGVIVGDFSGSNVRPARDDEAARMIDMTTDAAVKPTVPDTLAYWRERAKWTDEQILAHLIDERRRQAIGVVKALEAGAGADVKQTERLKI